MKFDATKLSPPQVFGQLAAPTVSAWTEIPATVLRHVSAVGWEEGKATFRLKTRFGLLLQLDPLTPGGVVWYLSSCCAQNGGRLVRPGFGELQYCRGCGAWSPNPFAACEGEEVALCGPMLSQWSEHLLTDPLERTVMASELQEELEQLTTGLKQELDLLIADGKVVVAGSGQ